MHFRNIILTALCLQAFLLSAQTQTENATKLQTNPDALNFILMGDWGRNGTDHQRAIAEQMGKVADKASIDFITTTGDNFYEIGVLNEYDPQWNSSYEDVYTMPSLQCPWYPTLGNHDYGLNPDAQVAYSKISKRWKMPARYYSKVMNLNGDSTQQVLFVFIDTTPLIPFYYRGKNVHSTDKRRQKQWIKETLSNASPNVKWKFVIGHHPMYTGGGRTNNHDTKSIRRKLQPVFEKYKVNAFLAGHEHNLQYMISENGIHHFISGSGSEITPVTQLDISRFAASDYGFMLFSLTPEKYVVQVISLEGNILYTTEVKRK